MEEGLYSDPWLYSRMQQDYMQCVVFQLLQAVESGYVEVQTYKNPTKHQGSNTPQKIKQKKGLSGETKVAPKPHEMGKKKRKTQTKRKY